MLSVSHQTVSTLKARIPVWKSSVGFGFSFH